MVYGLVAQIGRQTGAYLIPKLFKTFQRMDVTYHARMYGKSAGKGVRHGRDLGAAVGTTLSLGSSGDDLDGVPTQRTTPPSGKKYQAHRGQYNRRPVRTYNNCTCDRNRRKSKFRKYY